MAEQDGPRGDTRDDAREHRLQALRNLARQQGQPPSPMPATSAPPTSPATTHATARRGRRMVILGIAVLLVAIAAGALAYLRPHPDTANQPAVPSQLVVDFAAQHLGCVQDAVWSPDGVRLAVLGYTDVCPVPVAPLGYYRYAAGLLNIYPSQTGKKPLQLSPDDLINAVLHLPPAQLVSITNGSVTTSTAKMAIQYSRVLWSRDGKRLVLPFLVDEFSNARATSDGDATWDDTRVTGVLLMDADGSHPRAFSHTLGKQDSLSGRWDLSTGTYTLGSSVATGQYGDLAPALTYTWDANGHLQPQAPLIGTTPPPAPPLAPIGDPTGDASFTIWQPAAIGPVSIEGYPPSSLHAFILPATYTYLYNLTAWSPNGRWLWTSPSSQSNLRDPNQPAPTADQLALAKKWHMDGALLPVRDKALSAVLAANPPDSLYHRRVSTTSFAWSPDGKRLAAIRILPGDSTVVLPGQYLVDIYDCATGKQLATLTPALRIASSSYSMSTTLLRWSRDGSRLLIYDTVLDEATIWGPGKLPMN